jgi:hypothetical protein
MPWKECHAMDERLRPGGGLPVPLNHFRDEDSNTRVYRANWDRVITPTLLNRVSFGHNDWFQLRASFNRDQGWSTKIGLRNVPGPDKLFPLIDFSNDYLDWVVPNGEAPATTCGRSPMTDLGQDEPHVEVRAHRPAGSLRRLRLAHGRRHLQLQPRLTQGSFPTARSTEQARRATRSRPSCPAKSDPPKSPPIAMCLTGGATTQATPRTTGASATRSRSTTACAMSTPLRPGKASGLAHRFLAGTTAPLRAAVRA